MEKRKTTIEYDSFGLSNIERSVLIYSSTFLILTIVQNRGRIIHLKNRAEMKIKKLKETHFGLTFLATGNETDGKYFLSETIIPAGDNGPPVHVHSKEDEGFYLKKGKLNFIVNGKEIELQEGEYLNIEACEKHTWRNKTEFDAELLVTFVPAGIENMFKELEQNMSDIKKIGQKYGTEF